MPAQKPKKGLAWNYEARCRRRRCPGCCSNPAIQKGDLTNDFPGLYQIDVQLLTLAGIHRDTDLTGDDAEQCTAEITLQKDGLSLVVVPIDSEFDDFVKQTAGNPGKDGTAS
jgi:hypothetical protein